MKNSEDLTKKKIESLLSLQDNIASLRMDSKYVVINGEMYKKVNANDVKKSSLRAKFYSVDNDALSITETDKQTFLEKASINKPEINIELQVKLEKVLNKIKMQYGNDLWRFGDVIDSLTSLLDMARTDEETLDLITSVLDNDSKTKKTDAVGFTIKQENIKSLEQGVLSIMQNTTNIGFSTSVYFDTGAIKHRYENSEKNLWIDYTNFKNPDKTNELSVRIGGCLLTESDMSEYAYEAISNRLLEINIMHATTQFREPIKETEIFDKKLQEFMGQDGDWSTSKWCQIENDVTNNFNKQWKDKVDKFYTEVAEKYPETVGENKTRYRIFKVGQEVYYPVFYNLDSVELKSDKKRTVHGFTTHKKFGILIDLNTGVIDSTTELPIIIQYTYQQLRKFNDPKDLLVEPAEQSETV